jgi:hypothetical protein
MQIKLLQKKLKTRSLIYLSDGHLRIHHPYLHEDYISINLTSLKLHLISGNPISPYPIPNGKLWISELANKYHREKVLFMWEKLEELIKTGKISYILNNNDKIKKPFNYYLVKDGKLVNVLLRTSKYPFIDLSGNLIPKDVILHKTPRKAIQKALLQEVNGEKLASKSLAILTQAALDASVARNKYISNIAKLKELLSKTQPKSKTIKPKAK